MYRHLLVPVDASDAGIEALGHAVELAHSIGARITFFHLRPAPGAGGCAHTRSTVYEVTAEEREWELFSKAEAAARAQGVFSGCSSAAGEPSRAILAVARERQCDLICVMPGRAVPAPGAIPVLTCPVDRESVAALVIGRLLEDHRAVANAVHASLAVIRSAALVGCAVPNGALRLLIRDLRDVQLSRRKEEGWLFRKLRERTCALEADLGELERQHARAEQILADLAAQLEREPPLDAPELDRGISDYARVIWEHQGRTEGVILPAARRYFTDADWEEIDAAFDLGVRTGHFRGYVGATPRSGSSE
jgi:hemerythrin-like domain-containing protein